MSLEMGALPGTIRTASVVLHIDSLEAGASGLATVSLDGVRFNEVDAPAVFSALWLHSARSNDLRVELSSMSDALEEWPRWTARREFTVQVWNLSAAPLSGRDVPLLLQGFPVAIVPQAAKWTRKAALPLPTPSLSLAGGTGTGSAVTASDALGAPLLCGWHALSNAPFLPTWALEYVRQGGGNRTFDPATVAFDQATLVATQNGDLEFSARSGVWNPVVWNSLSCFRIDLLVVSARTISLDVQADNAARVYLTPSGGARAQAGDIILGSGLVNVPLSLTPGWNQVEVAYANDADAGWAALLIVKGHGAPLARLVDALRAPLPIHRAT